MSSILVGIEDAFGIMIGDADITLELFGSIASLTRYVRRSLTVTP
jgi:acyl carrier protein